MGHPAPKPTKLKILEGNPGKRPLNQCEPQPTPGVPSCPTWLDPEAKAEWKRVVPELERLGLLALIDRGAVAAYCQAWSEFHTATQTLQKEGRTLTTDKGYTYPHPAVAQQRSAWQAVRQFSALFGLDPSSRSKIQVPGQPTEADQLDSFLKSG